MLFLPESFGVFLEDAYLVDSMGFKPEVVPFALGSATSFLGFDGRGREAVAIQVEMETGLPLEDERSHPRRAIDLHVPTTTRPGAFPGQNTLRILSQHSLQSHTLHHVCSTVLDFLVNRATLLVLKGHRTVVARQAGLRS